MAAADWPAVVIPRGGSARQARASRGNDESEDVRALATRARTDPDAFAALYRIHVDRIHAFAYRRTGSRPMAEDVTAATFEAAWRAMPVFEWKGAGFEPWLFRIAANELASLRRREGRANRPRGQLALRELAGGVEPDFAGEDRDATSELEVEAIRAALPNLVPRYQEAISFRYFSGLSNELAAEAMGCSRAVMAVTLHRALTALRREIGRGVRP